MGRRVVRSVLVVATVAVALVVIAPRAEAVTNPYRRWLGSKNYTCGPNGIGGVQVTLSNQNVEFFALPADAQFTINYINNGVTETSGPYTVEKTSGTQAYGSFQQVFDSYPFTFEFRLDTLINGSVVYTSSLSVTCTGAASGTVSAVNTVVPTDAYRRWTSPKSFTCEANGGSGKRVVLNNQNVEFNDLPANAQFTLNYIRNGVTETDGPYTVEKTSGTQSYGSFLEAFDSYPFTFEFRLDTLINGSVVYTSKLSVHCTGDATGTVRPINAVPTPTPFASWTAFVNRQYQDLTAKAPTPGSLAFWIGALGNGSRTKGDLIEGLRRGSDNTTNVDPTVRLYRAFLQRTPDAGGLRFWVTRRRNGSWTLVRMAQSFATSSEFINKYGALTNEQFVKRIYTDVLERTPDSGGVTFWTNQLDTHRRSRGAVMVGFSESSEYKRKQAENTDVAAAYIFLMGRKPTTFEVADWVARQKDGTSQAELAKELLTSAKYATHIAG
jgi:hypothetical protein